MRRFIAALFITALSTHLSLASNLEATATCTNCTQSSQKTGTSQVQDLCASIEKRCADVDEDMRLSCTPTHPIINEAMEGIGCIAGVYNSTTDFLLFLFEIGKLFFANQLKSQLFLPKHLAGAIINPTASFKNLQSQIELTQAQAMSAAQLSNYLVREFEVSRREVGVSKTISNKIVGPILKTVYQEIETFISQNIHDFGCYNAFERWQMVCNAAADFLIPPAAYIALLKGGGKKILQQFPKVAKAIKKIQGNLVAASKIANVKRKYAFILSSTSENKDEIVSLILKAERKGITAKKIEETILRAMRECVP